MKKFLSILIACSLLLLSACSQGQNSQSDSSSVITEETVTTSKPKFDNDEFFKKADEDNDGIMIKNGDFTNGTTTSWGTFKQGGSCSLSATNGELCVTVKEAGKVIHGVQLFQDGFELVKGCKYNVSFDAYSTIARQIENRVQINGGDYHAYASTTADLTTEKQTFTYEFDMVETTDKTPRFVFNLGLPNGVESLEEHNVFLDNISIELLDETNKSTEDVGPFQGIDINIDQIGYYKNDTKIAVFRGEDVDKTFDVVNADTDAVVFTGNIEKGKENLTANETDFYGDFSSLTDDGTYYIKTEKLGKSYEFKIGADVYNGAFDDVVKMFYLQRCGCEIPEKYGDGFTHAACHTGEALIYGETSGKKIDVSGGWHDAGDYGRYVAPGAKAAADLILAYENNPSSFSDKSGIPESGNGIPDVLDEVKYELDWMLKMQDKTSGGVYHKVTGENFAGMVMPDTVTDQLYLSPISITATEDFAAVMALSSRVYEKYNKDFSQKCKSAAIKAYDYVEGTSVRESFKNPEGISTGEYPDDKYRDERFWAACELYRVTGDSKYQNAIKDQITKEFKKGFGWADMGYYGFVAYINTDKSLIDQNLYTELKNEFIERANKVVEKSSNDGYFCSIGTTYYWGSNGGVANDAMTVLLANKIQPDKKYTDTAKNLVHYLFGANALSTCYLTGYGTVSPLNTHHRPSTALKTTMKGMLVGGPNSNLEDPCAKTLLSEMPAAKCYVDNAQAYSCNEITIYWNSPLVYVLGELTK